MNIIFKNDTEEYSIKLNKLAIIFKNSKFNSEEFFSKLAFSIEKKKQCVSIDGISSVDINTAVSYFSNRTSFFEEFKFTKNNFFRNLIYSQVLNTINQEKVLTEMNNLLDIIDNKVNKNIKSKLTKGTESKLNFDININNIDKIIEKFTDIYCDEILLTQSATSKNLDRLLLYDLIKMYSTTIDKETIIIIDEFDLFLDINQSRNILKTIEELSSKNPFLHFIITTNNNVINYLNEEYAIYYTRSSKLLKLENYNYYAEKHLILEEPLLQENPKLITEEDIKIVLDKFIYPHIEKIGILILDDSKEIICGNSKNKFYSSFNNLIIYDKALLKFMKNFKKSIDL